MTFPRFYLVRQSFNRTRVEDIPGTVRREILEKDLLANVTSGQTVAVPVGSRGIANIEVITRAICETIRDHDGVPVIVPAMGSHGGGTPEGQRSILEGYGVTEEFCCAEIRSSVETVIVEQTPLGFPVHFDRVAHGCDHVLIVGRVKAHTRFVGPVESGLHKMMLIGLGNRAGAEIYHRAILEHDFETIVLAVGKVVLERCGVLGGLAIVENGYDETGHLEAVRPAEFLAKESELLEKSLGWLPSLPFPQVDVLIVDRIGKNISGSGMDTNVVGRKFDDHHATERDRAACRRIVVRGLTEETHGNACGIGIAEYITDHCLSQVDRETTRVNTVSSGHPSAGATPLTYPTDREAIEAAMSSSALAEPENQRVVQIRDTLHLETVLVSEVHADEISERDDLEILDGPLPMDFSANGRLRDV